jgi:hypothetical protein
MTRIAVGGAGASGIKWPNYVNGRLLTAEDLRVEQLATLDRDRWLGLAVGNGVVCGLEVSGSPRSSVLQVSPGTGVSPGGTAVHLDSPATIDLSVVSSSAPVDGALFAECRPPSTQTVAPTAGAYLLTVAPASSYAGKVPVAGSPNASLPTPCTSRWQVGNVVFAAIHLVGFDAKTTPANRRNLLAHFCFGSSNLDALAMSGFTEPDPWRGFDGLAELTPCDLPLSVFDWDGSALTFVDMWSARRRTSRSPATVALAAVVTDQRAADGEARFLQFQDQLDGLQSTPAGRSVRALDVFPLLPPAGLVPFDAIAMAKQLLAEQPDFGAAVGTKQDKIANVTKPMLNKMLIAQLQGAALAAFANSKLGLVSQEMLHMQQQIDALRAEVDHLTEALAGAKGRASTSAAAAGRRLAAAVVSALVDSPAEGLDPTIFFAGLRLRVGVVDQETVDFTVRRSWYDCPIDLGTGDVLNVFFVLSSDGETVAPYLLFAKRQRGVRWIYTAPRTLGT